MLVSIKFEFIFYVLTKIGFCNLIHKLSTLKLKLTLYSAYSNYQ